jgi:hypothetical protein
MLSIGCRFAILIIRFKFTNAQKKNLPFQQGQANLMGQFHEKIEWGSRAWEENTNFDCFLSYQKINFAHQESTLN